MAQERWTRLPADVDPGGPRGSSLARLGLEMVPAHECDQAELLRFELEERDYFRRWIPDRGDAYYELPAVRESLRNAREWWHAGTDRLHVVTGADGRVVARANLVYIEDGSGEVGYRVAREVTGQGVATAAVADLLAIARRLGLQEVKASTSVENGASARVLIRCGFAQIGFRPAATEVAGRRLDQLDWHMTLT